MEFTDNYFDKKVRPNPGNCRTFRFDPAHLRRGANQLTLGSLAAGDLEIERVNLALW